MALLVTMEQLALSATRTDAPAGKFRAQQCVFLLALCAQWAVTFEEVAADFSLAGHIHVAVGAVAVTADPLQEVGAHGHLLLGHMVREGTGPVCLLTRTPDKSGTHGHFLRIMDIGAALATVAPAKAVVIHAVLSLLLLLLLCLTDDGQAALDCTAGQGTTAAGGRVQSSCAKEGPAAIMGPAGGLGEFVGRHFVQDSSDAAVAFAPPPRGTRGGFSTPSDGGTQSV